jgi:hypothetical protein
MVSFRGSLSGTDGLRLMVPELPLPSRDERLFGAETVGYALGWGSMSAAAKISADAMTRRSEEVNI